MKKIIRKILRNLGIEISRYNSSNSSAAQLVRTFELNDINMVFDIGANEGQFASELREHGYKGKIVSFEPLSKAGTKLSYFASYDPEWVVHQRAAIGDHDGKVEINVAGNSVSSSVLPMLQSHLSAAENSAYIGSESVPIFKIDSIANIYLTPGINLFIKIDTQGFEWQVLDGASKTLRHARGILCEMSLVPLYSGQSLYRDIIDRLNLEGFKLWALQKGFTDSRTGQSLQIDGVFLRNDISNK